MSLQFSDTTNKKGIVQVIWRETGSDSVSYPIEEITADVNITLDSVWQKIFKLGGTWQYDDYSHSDYPIITTNLVAGQRDYAFITDESGNIILDIYKVMVKQPDGTYKEITPVDVQSQSDMQGFYDGRDIQGTPTRYDKTANAIFLDAIPDSTVTDGLKVYINREGEYFTTSDTTKKAGFHGTIHEILAIRPAFNYAMRHSLPQVNGLQVRLKELEKAIEDTYGLRTRDEKKRMIPNRESTR